ncbi:hypothetical protein SLUN_05695 [Streptomyces lunaelactis]|uniref:Uracil-DNA glycosylase-like domain-containing protein n=1 Tax=Streptomyces lunaelactis TaxID=1535768 RepID=A0A2R4SY11_9ACTN|nr:hypothetical protein SLUN_05695 [Streptomyces lunaelactis]
MPRPTRWRRWSPASRRSSSSTRRPPATPLGRSSDPEELKAARDRVIDDVVAGGLRVLFCGINRGPMSAATGHHFARPGNRFWPVLLLCTSPVRV